MAARPQPSSDTPFRSREDRAQDHQRKREAVLCAAVRMFNDRGFHAASLDDVAATLGISKPTIYHYLGNKERVLIECVSRGLEQLGTAAEECRNVPGSGLDRLKIFLQRYAEINMDDFGRCVIRTGEELLSAEGAVQFLARKREIDGAMRSLIREGIDDGSISPRDIKLTAFALAGALNWPARWYKPGGQLSASEVGQRLVQELVAGLQPRPERG